MAKTDIYYQSDHFYGFKEASSSFIIKPAQELLNTFLKHYRNRQFSDAENLAKGVRRNLLTHQIAWETVGTVYSETGRRIEALRGNQTAVALSPEDAAAHHNRGNTLRSLDRLGEAVGSYNVAIT